ncbi:MAG: hypothetical protein H0U74_06335 [Bradymonadaceae bacterium]|nr:hypothetical protein [Lujinxingiaceae bacterium]
MQPLTLMIIALVFAALALGCDKGASEPAVAVAPEQSARTGAAVADESKTSVLLFANAGKGESSCGCGQIIRMVRMVGERGATVQEIDRAKNEELVAKHNVKEEPTVIFLDAQGNELQRFEGEQDETIDGLRDALKGLVEKT